MSSSGSALQFGSPEYFRQVSRGTHPPAMFATAKEIVNTHHLGDMDHPLNEGSDIDDEEDYRYAESKEDLLQHKLDNNPDISESIRDYGFDWGKEHFDDDPITVRNDTLLDGHHRVANMLAYRPNEFVPIKTVQ